MEAQTFNLKAFGIINKIRYEFRVIIYRFPLLRRLYMRIGFNLVYLSRPRWDTGKPPKELVELVDSGVLKPGRTIDLGCGRGHAVRYLQLRGFDAWGIDASYWAIRQAINISSMMGLPSSFIRADVLSYTPSEKYSLVLDVGLFHNFLGEERRSFAENGYRQYLSEGGGLLLWCKNEDNPKNAPQVSKRELLGYFSGDWQVIELRKTSLIDPEKRDYYFMRAALKYRTGVKPASLERGPYDPGPSGQIP